MHPWTWVVKKMMDSQMCCQLTGVEEHREVLEFL